MREQVIVPQTFHIEQEYRRRSFELFKTELKAVEGVENILSQVNTIQCVASNGPPIKIIHNLEVTGLLKHFEPGNIFSGHDIQKFKPDPGLFLHVAQTCGMDPHECLVIEDSEHGAHAAQQAGMACFGYAAETDPDLFLNLQARPFYHMAELHRELRGLGLVDE